MNSFWDVIQYLLRCSRILLGRSLPSPLPYPKLNNIVCLGNLLRDLPFLHIFVIDNFLTPGLIASLGLARATLLSISAAMLLILHWVGSSTCQTSPPFLSAIIGMISRRLPIVNKEARALVLSIQVCKSLITNSRLDVQTDNRAFMQSWLKQRGKNSDL